VGALAEACSYIQPFETVNESIVAAGSQPVLLAAVVKIPLPPLSGTPLTLTIQKMMWFAASGTVGVKVRTVLPALQTDVAIGNCEVLVSINCTEVWAVFIAPLNVKVIVVVIGTFAALLVGTVDTMLGAASDAVALTSNHPSNSRGMSR
jgi:hypothetical protein